MMLKTRFTLFALALATMGRSQTFSFTAQGNTWRVEEARENPNNKFYYTFQTGGDTTVQGLVYRKWFQNQELIGLLREDSLGTVFFVDLSGQFYGNGPNQELELYKFNAQPGDSTVFWRSSDNKRVKFTVLQIDSLEIFGQRRKLISAVPDDQGFWFGNWIEGIGSEITPLQPLTEIKESGWYLFCFNGTNPDGLGCALSTAVLPGYMGLRITPNPVSTLAQIDGLPADGHGHIWVFNASGTLTLRQDIGTASALDVSRWANGVYFVEIRSGNASALRKLVVCH